ncbi:glycosyltransferase [Zhihengliuella halotolerans]|uniref:glycosyltransferase n=1 Tax=Zhihengliuella halotolerans TaxID=370736 RepID=UPI000C80CE33|nr:glycosyltransferase [Zhihengliuella halotolerans]
MKVLHVTECYAGGVSRAMNTLAAIYEGEHHLLWAGEDSPPGAFVSSQRLPDGLLERVRSVRRAVATIQPDLVHAHSSWAGVYTRLLPIGVPVAYEPHCFVFDDPKRPTYLRAAYWAAESALSVNTNVTIALTPHEAKLAKRLRPLNRVRELPNVATVDLSLARSAGGGTGSERYTVSMVGRVARQKDPEYFAEVALAAKRAGASWRFVWIGDGNDAASRIVLANAGVEITGWLDGAELVETLQRSDMYLHSASYEGFPLSVLDAAALSIPIIVRDVACFEGFDLMKASTPEDATRRIRTVATSLEVRRDLTEKSRALTARMSVEAQRAGLDAIYREAIA